MNLNNFCKYLVTGLVLLLSFGFGAAADNAPDSQKTYDLNLSLDKPTVGEFTKEFTEKTGVLFSYDSSISKKRMANVRINVKGRGLDDILEVVFKTQNKGFSYEIVSDSILLFFKESVPVRKKAVIRGVVCDDAGLPLMGAGIFVKGTDHGCVSDLDGNYEIEAGEEDVLVFSALGFSNQEIKIGESSEINVKMSTDVNLLDEVVVVGYGTQKKVNLTGAVSMIGSKEMNARPISDAVSGLQGLLPGVTVVNPSGQPGASSSTIRVRGVGTIGNANPLVLIDGVEGDMSSINPDDIESVSVLKDAASAAIYGARAANGVLLVTTKKLKKAEKSYANVSVGAYIGLQTPTRLPEMCNALEFMELDNESRLNIGSPVAWQQADMDKVVSGSDPNHFADTDWMGAVLNKFAPQQNYTLNVNGGLGKSSYMLSYRYFDQKGLTVGSSTGNKRHNVRFKLNTELLDFIHLNSNISYINNSVKSPVNSLSNGGGAIYSAMRIGPYAPIKYTDGQWAYGGGNTNPVAILTDGGYTNTRSDETSITEVLKVDLVKGWDVSATYNLTTFNGLREVLKKTITFRDPDTQEVNQWGNPNSYRNTDLRHVQQTFILQSNFDVKFGRQQKHNLSGVVGMSQEWYKNRSFEASRTGLATELNPSINLGNPASMSNDGKASSWAIRSGFGRLNYNFDERYLMEVNLRYDLSSRFHKNNRGGLFPSVSGAWRISEESFMESARTVLDNLKIRASWGMLGNQYVGSSNYPYMSILKEYTSGSLIGTMPNTGYTQSTLANPDLTWERIKMLDVGLDVSMFHNRLNFSFDWFNKDTEGILLQLNYPDQIGATPSEQNAGKVNNMGWEMNMSWREQRGDFFYGIGLNLSDVRNKITDLAGNAPDLSGHQVRMVGQPIDAFYGYVAEGLMTPEDFKIYDESTGMYNLPKVPVILGNNYQPGDIKYKDISGPDGVPDGRITPEYDKVVLGSAIPRYTYSINGDFAWKGLDFSFVLQGVGKCDGYLEGSARHALQDMAAYPQKVHMDRYHVTKNPNPNASYPRLTYNTGFNQNTFSTFWMEDASYFRLKNVQVGYTFPEKWMKKARIDKLRIYFSGDNLATASKYFYAYDPETPVSKGGYYPQVRTFVIGLNVTFK